MDTSAINQDYYWMAKAIRLAQRGLYTTSPNPRVGCVIVSPDNHCVGEGAHLEAGTPHAEVHALKQAGELAKGATAYVTLEPCVMCVGAMLHARIARLVFGAHDPKSGAAGSVLDLCDESALNHRIEVNGGLGSQSRMTGPCDLT